MSDIQEFDPSQLRSAFTHSADEFDPSQLKPVSTGPPGIASVPLPSALQAGSKEEPRIVGKLKGGLEDASDHLNQFTQGMMKPGLGLVEPGIVNKATDWLSRKAGQTSDALINALPEGPTSFPIRSNVAGALSKISEGPVSLVKELAAPFQGTPGVPFATNVATEGLNKAAEMAPGVLETATSPMGVLSMPLLGSANPLIAGATKAAIGSTMAPAAGQSIATEIQDPTAEHLADAAISSFAALSPQAKELASLPSEISNINPLSTAKILAHNAEAARLIGEDVKSASSVMLNKELQGPTIGSEEMEPSGIRKGEIFKQPTGQVDVTSEHGGPGGTFEQGEPIRVDSNIGKLTVEQIGGTSKSAGPTPNKPQELQGYKFPEPIGESLGAQRKIFAVKDESGKTLFTGYNTADNPQVSNFLNENGAKYLAGDETTKLEPRDINSLVRHGFFSKEEGGELLKLAANNNDPASKSLTPNEIEYLKTTARTADEIGPRYPEAQTLKAKNTESPVDSSTKSFVDKALKGSDVTTEESPEASEQRKTLQAEQLNKDAEEQRKQSLINAGTANTKAELERLSGLEKPTPGPLLKTVKNAAGEEVALKPDIPEDLIAFREAAINASVHRLDSDIAKVGEESVPFREGRKGKQLSPKEVEESGGKLISLPINPEAIEEAWKDHTERLAEIDNQFRKDLGSKLGEQVKQYEDYVNGLREYAGVERKVVPNAIDDIVAKEKRPAGERPQVPEEGVPERVYRVQDARNRLAEELTKDEKGGPRSFKELNNPERLIIDHFVIQGHGFAYQPEAKKSEATPPSASTGQAASPASKSAATTAPPVAAVAPSEEKSFDPSEITAAPEAPTSKEVIQPSASATQVGAISEISGVKAGDPVSFRSPTGTPVAGQVQAINPSSETASVITPSGASEIPVANLDQAKPEAKPHDYASTHLGLSSPIADKAREFSSTIPEDRLTEGGRESDPHVTLLYGLTNDDPSVVAKQLKGHGPIEVRLADKMSLFKNDDADVLKVDVESKALNDLHEKISNELPNEDSHPIYQPHVTIAYLLPGEGDKYVGKPIEGVTGKTMVLGHVTFSPRAGEKTHIPLIESKSTSVESEKPVETPKPVTPAPEKTSTIGVEANEPTNQQPASPTGSQPLESQLPAGNAGTGTGQPTPVSGGESSGLGIESPRTSVGERSELEPSGGTISGVVGDASEPERTFPPRAQDVVSTHHDRDYRIPDGRIVSGSPEARAKNNIAAIQTLREIQGESRPATVQEQEILAGYVGWGAVPQIFAANTPEWKALQRELQKLITPEEYSDASRSTTNSHYTGDNVVDAMWKTMQALGAKPGMSWLEPAVGVGNFFGRQPEELLEGARRIGLDKDSLTGQIAKLLYPDSGIDIGAFEDSELPDDYFDAAISNVPFGNFGVHDPKFRGKPYLTNPIHNYFFAKSMTMVRPGGVVGFVTSRYTMDGFEAGHTNLRKWLSDRADFLGAVRLPSGAFRQNAGTDVITDIIFLRRHIPGEVKAGEDWIQSNQKMLKGEFGSYPVSTNEYYAKHPEMVLGTESLSRGQFSNHDYDVKGSVTQSDIESALQKVASAGGFKDFTGTKTSKTRALRDINTAQQSKLGGLFFDEKGDLFRRTSKGSAEPIDVSEVAKKRIKGQLAIRDALVKLTDAELADAPDADLNRLRKALNSTYDSYVKEHGFLSARGNTSVMDGDPDALLLVSLERRFQVGNKSAKIPSTAEKAPIFDRRMLRPPKTPTSVNDPKEALYITLNDRGRVDWDRMSELTGKKPAELQEELAGLVFEDPTTKTWQTAEEYLSGSVRKKLKQAEIIAKIEPKYQGNVDALKSAQPDDIPPGEIRALLGVTWVPIDVYSQFAGEMLGQRSANQVKVKYAGGEWVVDAGWNGLNNVTKWSTARVGAVQLLTDALNMRRTKVTDRTADGGSVVNPSETKAARARQMEMQDNFEAWLFQDANRGDKLARIYNDLNNDLRLRTYDGSHLTLPGMSRDAAVVRGGDLDPHQKAAVWRGIVQPNVLLAHSVGSGKTFEMIAIGMELKRLGLIQRPMYVVPNATLTGWQTQFSALYPQKRTIVFSEKDLEKGNRQKVMAQIATGDWDAVVVPHSSFQFIPTGDAIFDQHFKKLSDELEDAIGEAQAAGIDTRQIKRMEKAKERLLTSLKDKRKADKKDKTVTWEQLGIDQLFIDESHSYKKLGYSTKQGNVAGIDQNGNQKTFDLLMKMRHTQSHGRGVVFATGTPITNTMGELFSIMKYLIEPELQARGIGKFDEWAANYGRTVDVFEPKVEGGGYQLKARFAKFVNLPEIIQLFRSFADVVTPDMINLPVPKIAGGQRMAMEQQLTSAQSDYLDGLRARAGSIRRDPRNSLPDNMLAVYIDAAKMALDLRMVQPSAADDTNGRLNQAADTIYKHWKDSSARRGTQLVMLDMGKPASAGGSKDFSAYDELIKKLEQRGIPKNEIAHIYQAKTKTQRTKLFQDVNDGKIRVVLGSTEKMGVGTNVQQRLYALHHLDVPHRPSDLEQREGRILRQGNENPEVYIHYYVTRGSLDEAKFSNVTRKAKFINQVMQGKSTVREAEDVGGMIPSLEMFQAMASGDPRVMQKMEVDAEVDRLSGVFSAWKNQQYGIRREIQEIPNRIHSIGLNSEVIQRDIKIRNANPDKFEINGKVISGDKASKEVNEALRKDAAKVFDEKLKDFDAGTAYGLPILISSNGPDLKIEIGDASTIFISRDEATIADLYRRIRNKTDELEERIASNNKTIENLHNLSGNLDKSIEPVWPYATKFQEMVAKQGELAKELGAGKDDDATTAVGEGGEITDNSVEASEEDSDEDEEESPENEVADYAQKQPKAASRILKAVNDLEPVKGVPVSTQRLRAELSDLSKEEFDKAALELRREQKVFLSLHHDPHNISQDERAKLIDEKNGNYHVGIAVREPVSRNSSGGSGDFPKPEETIEQNKTAQPQAPPTEEEVEEILNGSSGERGAASVGFITLGLDKFVEESVIPTAHEAAKGLAEIYNGFIDIYAPDAAGKIAKLAALTFRQRNAEHAREMNKAQKAAEKAHKFFANRTDAENKKFILDYFGDENSPLPQYGDKDLDQMARLIRKMLDKGRDDVQSLGTGKLQKVYENYLGRVWKDWRKADQIYASFFSRRPLEGKKGFLKQRKYPTWQDGFDAGLEPVSYNPMDLMMLKYAEMQRYVMAHRVMNDWKEKGLLRFVKFDGDKPIGWKQVADPIGTVYGPSTQNISEFPNEGLYKALSATAQALGVTHTRGFMNLRGAVGRAQQGGGIKTLHGTAEDVLAHEIGHQIDWLAGSGNRFLRYGDPTTAKAIKDLRNQSTNPANSQAVRKAARQALNTTYKRAIKQQSVFNRELKALADLRSGPKAYTHKREEKMALLAEMWVGAREAFEKTAPNVFADWKKFLGENPKLHALRDIQGNTEVMTLNHKYDVGGLVTKGHWYAPDGAATILNNYLGPGLRQAKLIGPVYKAIFGANNVLQQFQLGLSAFHLGFTTMESMTSQLAVGIENAMRGNLSSAAREVSKTPFAPITTLWTGNKILKEWYAPGSQGALIADIVQSLEVAGGRARMDEIYGTKFKQQVWHALKNGNWLTGLIKTPFAVVEAFSDIIMRQLVPRMKLGVFAAMAVREMERLGPGATMDQVRERMASAWDSVDNRMGQMVYDNLFLDNYAKDAAMVLVRSVGWNLGTFREVGGGVIDMIRVPLQLAGGKPPEDVNLNKISYNLAMIIVAMTFGAIYTYLATGKRPKELKDYYFPPNGDLDNKGHPERVSPPMYPKQIYEGYEDPAQTAANKIAPIWGVFGHIKNNENFHGEEMYHAGDKPEQIAKELVVSIAKEFIPFNIGYMHKAVHQGESVFQIIQPNVGITAAPSSINKTDAERLAEKLEGARIPKIAKTKQKADEDEAKRDISRLIAQKKPYQEKADEYLKEGIISKRDIDNAKKNAKIPPLERAFKPLELDEALRVWDKATPEEKKELRQELTKKAANFFASHSANERKIYQPLVKKALAVQ